MKVAYLLGSLNRGGAENLILDIFQKSNYAKFDFIGIHRKGGTYVDSFRNTSKKFIHCPFTNHNAILYLHRLRKLLLENEITIVHPQQSIDALLARLATLGTGIKVVLTVHGFDFGQSIGAKFIKRICFKLCHQVCFVSKYEYDYYKQTYHLNNSGKFSILYNGINFSKILSNLSNQTHKRIQIGTVGSFRSGRDHFFICTFLNYLKHKGIDYDFYFIGPKVLSEPDRFDNCMNYCTTNNLNSNVHFLGSRDDVPALLSGLDAFIYCSEHDTFGIAVLEAIASGIPVFVNDWEVMSEITDNGKLATVYKTGSIEDLYEKFSCFIQNKEPLLEKANEGAKYVRDIYSIGRHINNLYDIYSKTV